jgi:hypothetical protein
MAKPSLTAFPCTQIIHVPASQVSRLPVAKNPTSTKITSEVSLSAKLQPLHILVQLFRALRLM